MIHMNIRSAMAVPQVEPQLDDTSIQGLLNMLEGNEVPDSEPTAILSEVQCYCWQSPRIFL